MKKIKQPKEELIITPLERSRYTSEDLKTIILNLMSSPVYILDLETTGLNPRKDKIIGMGLGTLEKTWYLFADELTPSMWCMLRALFSKADKTIIGHNLLFDLDVLVNNGNVIHNQLWDTKAAAFLVNENRSLKLKDLGKTMFNLEVVKFKDVNWVDENMVEKYGKQDIDITRMIYNEYKKEMDNGYPLFYKLYMPLIWTIIDAQNNGIKIDVKYLKDIFWELKDEVSDLKSQIKKEIDSLCVQYAATVDFVGKEIEDVVFDKDTNEED